MFTEVTSVRAMLLNSFLREIRRHFYPSSPQHPGLATASNAPNDDKRPMNLAWQGSGEIRRQPATLLLLVILFQIRITKKEKIMDAVSELMETVKAAGPIGGASMVTGAIVLLGILKKVHFLFYEYYISTFYWVPSPPKSRCTIFCGSMRFHACIYL